MTVSTTLTMSNGRGIDLLNPKVTDIDFLVIAEHLAKDNRYCGATKGIVYSVAEHSVRCADAALRETDDMELARYLLCHDMHEAFLGDDTTPKKRAVASIAEEHFGILDAKIMSAFNLMTDRFDVVIHEAAGLAWPPDPVHKGAIKQFDRRLLATEWRDLMRCPAPHEFAVDPLFETIEPLPTWKHAADLFIRRCMDMLPGLDAHQELIRRGETS